MRKTYISPDKDLSKCIPPLKLQGIATYRKNKAGAYLIIVFNDILGNKRQLLITASAIGETRTLKRYLIENGFPHTTTKEQWTEIFELLNTSPNKKYELRENPGFHGTVYLQPDNSIIGKLNTDIWHPILDPNRKAPLPLVESKGTLNEWQQHVASSALYSSRIMLSLASGLSSYILGWAGIENGGFHLYGESSMGKSTCLYVAVSIRSGPDGVESWSLTETGLEELAAAHNDRMLALDESGKLDSDPVKAAQRAGGIIYILTFGKDKCRSTNYSAHRLTWRLGCLSTGEKSLSEAAKDAGVQKMLGEEVRMVDVPADAGFGRGIYESLPKGVEAAEYADRLKANLSLYYGSAEKAFLKALTTDLSGGADKLSSKIKAAIDEFFDFNKIVSTKGFDSRFAKRFALAYAGGKLAADYHVLPFTDCEVLAGITRCYQDSISRRPKSFQTQVQDAKSVLRTEVNNRKNFLDLSSPTHGKSLDEIESAKGYISTFKGETVRAIRPDYLKTLVPNDKIREAVLLQLKRENRLKTDASGKQTIQLRSHIKSQPALPRCYCISRNTNSDPKLEKDQP